MTDMLPSALERLDKLYDFRLRAESLCAGWEAAWEVMVAKGGHTATTDRLAIDAAALRKQLEATR